MLGKWQGCKKMLIQEQEMVRDAEKELSMMRDASGGIHQPVASVSAGGGGGAMMQPQDYVVPIYEAPRHRQHQQHQQHYDDPYRQPVVRSHTASEDDPDVWRPPTRDGRGAAAAPAYRGGRPGDDFRAGPEPAWARRNEGAVGRQAPARNVVAAAPPARRPGGPPAAAPAAGGAKGDRDRPWRQGMQEKAGGAASGGKEAPGSKGGKGAKKEYVGPDADLAQMLERDMLDGSPGISWADIAGLLEAKRVLEEATVLPLIMPDFFTGIRRPVKVRRGTPAARRGDCLIHILQRE